MILQTMSDYAAYLNEPYACSSNLYSELCLVRRLVTVAIPETIC